VILRSLTRFAGENAILSVHELRTISPVS